MSVYTPVFPAMPPPARPSPTSTSSSLSTNSRSPPIPYTSLLSQMHLTLATLPAELCPSSRPTSPDGFERIQNLKAEIDDAVEKGVYYWGDLISLACTRRTQPISRTPISAPKSVANETSAPPAYILAETEEEWFEWEEQMRLWRQTHGYGPRPILKERTISAHEKVESWKVHVKPGIVPSKTEAPLIHDAEEHTPSPLGFPVVKRLTATGKKGKQSDARRSRDPPQTKETESRYFAAGATSAVGKTAVQSGTVEQSSKIADHVEEKVASPPTSPKQIDDLPDLSLLPPSFPQHLETSTPPPLKRPSRASQAEPETSQPLISTPPSPPASNRAVSHPPSHPPAQAHSSAVVHTSSSPRSSPPSTHSLKRTRQSTPPPQPPYVPQTPLNPPLKKARTLPIIPSPRMTTTSTTATVTTTEAPIPSSFPMPIPISIPKTPESNRKGPGLGNARGLPIPRTPDGSGQPQVLPTLTDLLATSRRSKPRPRPPSRSVKSASKSTIGAYESPTKGGLSGRAGEEHVLPTVGEAVLEVAGPAASGGGEAEQVHIPSTPKTYLSSPASASPSTLGSTTFQLPFHPPSSPLFTQHASQFAPPFASSLVPGLSGAGSGSGLFGSAVGSLGAGSMGMYNSQFDVDGRVDRVSAFMERDVDFDGWLKDPEEEDGDVVRSSQGVVGVGM